MKGKTDWKKIKAMTEKDIVKAAKADPDAKTLTIKQLKEFKRVHPPKEVDVRAIRNKLHLSQELFAKYFGVSVRTIQEWEQHRRTPTATAKNFLIVINHSPKTVHKALSNLLPH